MNQTQDRGKVSRAAPHVPYVRQQNRKSQHGRLASEGAREGKKPPGHNLKRRREGKERGTETCRGEIIAE